MNNSRAGESRLRGVGDEWSWVHLIDQVIWLRLRFHVTSLASWSCRWTTHQHQSTRLYCSRQTTCYHRAPAYAGRHVSAIWLRVGEVEQEERVSVCWSWGWVTSKSRVHVTIKQRTRRSYPPSVWQSTDWTKFSHKNSRFEMFMILFVRHKFESVYYMWIAS